MSLYCEYNAIARRKRCMEIEKNLERHLKFCIEFYIGPIECVCPVLLCNNLNTSPTLLVKCCGICCPSACIGIMTHLYSSYINTHAEFNNHAKATYPRKHIINTFAYSLCFIRKVPRYKDKDIRF